jgi:Na+:H+ antiporter
MDLILSHTVSLLVAAIFVAIVARRLHLAYTVGLVVTGIGLALARIETEGALTHDFIFDVILPPLLFEAALAIHWAELRRDAFPVVTLATLGVVVSAVVVAGGMAGILGWPVRSAVVFGVLISATDPVAVIAMFTDTGVKGRLRLLVEKRSPFQRWRGGGAVRACGRLGTSNRRRRHDGDTGYSSAGRHYGRRHSRRASLGRAAIAVAGRTSDHLVETALTTVAAYGSFLTAQSFEMSGVLATVASGLLMGNLGVLGEPERKLLSSRGREFVTAFWEFAAFIANSLVFLLIGVTVAGIPFSTLGLMALAIAIVLVLIARALSVYPLCVIFTGSQWAIPIGQQHILWWGGLRGALALALALALPPSIAWRDEIVVAAFGVVTFSAVVQGTTMSTLMRTLGFLPRQS